MTPSAEVPGYLGRVLSAEGTPVGTCFQVRPCVLATAWHVLDNLDAGDVDAEVTIDPLGGGEPAAAVVRAIDSLRDLAVLERREPLPTSIVAMGPTASVPPQAVVMITGVPDFVDSRRFQFLDATGRWQGGAQITTGVVLGRIECKSLVQGMSGSPVRLHPDDRVVGVVSARYNSTDGWLRDSVWVARTEDLHPLLDTVTLNESPGLLMLPRAIGIKRVQTVTSSDGRSEDTFYILHMLHAGERLPVSRELVMFTSVENQEWLDLELWQQASPVESPGLDANRPLDMSGRIQLGAYRLPAYSPISITMTMDFEGTLHLRVFEPRSGHDLDMSIIVDVVIAAEYRRIRAALRELGRSTST
jgi:Trypsin-like peptidase domain